MSGWQALDHLLAEGPGDYSACVQDVVGRTVYAYRADTIRPAASLIKVPLAMALVTSDTRRRAGGEGIDLGTTVTLREEHRATGPGALEGSFDTAPVGTTRTLWELIGHALRESDNTAANLLIEALGMEQVQAFMRDELGLAATRLQRRFMDLAAAAAGRDNVTTTSEMCLILRALLEPGGRFDRLIEWLAQCDDGAKLRKGVPEDVVVAHKVGSLQGVEHDAGIVFARPDPYAVALLATNLPNEEIGKAAIARASQLIYREMNR